MFGKGIYFADIVSKAANYCCVNRANPEALLMLCEVALGNMHQVTKAKSYKLPPVGFHSVMGVGRMGVSEKEEVLGAEMGCGGIVENEEVGFSDLKFNELVVYDVGQVKMKYLLWCSVQLL
jgi:poly [ADP-ribose] polymerase